MNRHTIAFFLQYEQTRHPSSDIFRDTIFHGKLKPLLYACGLKKSACKSIKTISWMLWIMSDWVAFSGPELCSSLVDVRPRSRNYINSGTNVPGSSSNSALISFKWKCAITAQTLNLSPVFESNISFLNRIMEMAEILTAEYLNILFFR